MQKKSAPLLLSAPRGPCVTYCGHSRAGAAAAGPTAPSPPSRRPSAEPPIAAQAAAEGGHEDLQQTMLSYKLAQDEKLLAQVPIDD